MALSKINPNHIRKLISSSDPAIDWGIINSEEDKEKYEIIVKKQKDEDLTEEEKGFKETYESIEKDYEDRRKKYEEKYDISLLKFLKDEYPTVFLAKNVMSDSVAKIYQEHYKIKMPETIEGIKNISKENRPKVEIKDQNQMIISYFNMAISEYEENEKKFPCSSNTFSFAIVQEIGSHVMMINQLGESEKKS